MMGLALLLSLASALFAPAFATTGQNVFSVHDAGSAYDMPALQQASTEQYYIFAVPDDLNGITAYRDQPNYQTLVFVDMRQLNRRYMRALELSYSHELRMAYIHDYGANQQ